MAWSWSHTPGAYTAARDNLSRLPKKEIRVIWAEWKAHCSREDVEGGFDKSKYEWAMAEARTIPSDVLVDEIWNNMEELATCDNGGWNAWACPFGCHMVSFSFTSKRRQKEFEAGLLP